MVHFTGLLENARHPVGGPCRGTLLGDPCKNWVRARIGGWPGTATGGQIHVVHISHTHPPKEIIQALRKYLLGKKQLRIFHRYIIIFAYMCKKIDSANIYSATTRQMRALCLKAPLPALLLDSLSCAIGFLHVL